VPEEMHSEHILPLNSPKIFGTLKGIFFVKYTTMLYQWQLVKNKGIQSNFPGNFHDKISLRIKMFKERRSCGSNEGPVKFLSTRNLLSC
jgi:hypothetical protein